MHPNANGAVYWQTISPKIYRQIRAWKPKCISRSIFLHTNSEIISDIKINSKWFEDILSASLIDEPPRSLHLLNEKLHVSQHVSRRNSMKNMFEGSKRRREISETNCYQKLRLLFDWSPSVSQMLGKNLFMLIDRSTCSLCCTERIEQMVWKIGPFTSSQKNERLASGVSCRPCRISMLRQQKIWWHHPRQQKAEHEKFKRQRQSCVDWNSMCKQSLIERRRRDCFGDELQWFALFDIIQCFVYSITTLEFKSSSLGDFQSITKQRRWFIQFTLPTLRQWLPSLRFHNSSSLPFQSER